MVVLVLADLAVHRGHAVVVCVLCVCGSRSST
jgi:hypothetical protein